VGDDWLAEDAGQIQLVGVKMQKDRKEAEL
jgi:hypothetical protein